MSIEAQSKSGRRTQPGLVRLSMRCLLAIGSGACIAGEGSIDLTSGAGTPVCDAYLAAAKKWEYTSVGCLGDLPLEGKGIFRVTGPVTKREFSQDADDPTLTLRTNVMKFVMAHDVNLPSHYITAQLGEWSGTKEQIDYARMAVRNLTDMHYLEPVVRTVKIDIDNDGRLDTIFFYPHCVFGGSQVDTTTMSSPVILRANSADVDSNRTLKLLRAPIKQITNGNPRERGVGNFYAIADIYQNGAYGLFKFDRQTYFDFWWDAKEGAAPNPNDDFMLRVFQPSRSGAKDVCSFRVDPMPRR